MNAALFVRFQLLLVLHLLLKFQFAVAGTCWSTMAQNKLCKDVLSQNSNKEDCCTHHRIYAAWSSKEYDNITLFFNSHLGNGLPCTPCNVSCKNVKCDAPNKKCVVRKGRARCVCSSKCREGKVARKGPICGTDGRSYQSICRLRKHACRFKTNSLTIAYNGKCQTSCDKINCPPDMHCLKDQNLIPHCVSCSKRCSDRSKRREICGSDGLTYPSACHLREKTCRRGKAIPIAYKGPCQEGATCSTVRCYDRQKCMMDWATGRPRCVSCTSPCRPRQMHGTICGTNNSTYQNWCHMRQDSCKKGYFIDTKHPGKCTMNVV